MKTSLSFIVVSLLIAGAVFFAPSAFEYFQRSRLIALQESVRVPDPIPAQGVDSAPLPEETARSSSPSFVPPSAVNYDVPFTSQAPFGNWDALHKEACEEASVLMVVRFFEGREIVSPEDAEDAILALVARNEALGFPVDDTAEQIAILLHDVAPTLTAYVLEDPTVEQLKDALSRGSLVIVPAQGQQLRNPYFTAPGPRYHMLVLKGFTEDGYFITNDPGTKRGKNYVYRFGILMDAMHDWNGGDVESGAKRVVIVSR